MLTCQHYNGLTHSSGEHVWHFIQINPCLMKTGGLFGFRLLFCIGCMFLCVLCAHVRGHKSLSPCTFVCTFDVWLWVKLGFGRKYIPYCCESDCLLYQGKCCHQLPVFLFFLQRSRNTDSNSKPSSPVDLNMLLSKIGQLLKASTAV